MRNSGARPLNADRLQAPLARLLRPLVRLMIGAGVTFPALADLLRQLYVNVAENDFALSAKEQTDSRVSLLTGIHRKEVRRLRGAGAPVDTVPTGLSRTSRILARWLGDPAYGEGGAPRPLPRTAAPGRPSFEALVEGVTRDVRPRAVLDEWLDRALVTCDAEGRLVLAEAAYLPPAGDDGQLYYLGRNLHDHIAAAVANVEGRRPPFLERAVHYDGLSAELAERLARRSRDLALEVLGTANREALEHTDAAAGEGAQSDRGWRWNFGLYVYTEEVRLEGGTPARTRGP